MLLPTAMLLRSKLRFCKQPSRCAGVSPVKLQLASSKHMLLCCDVSWKDNSGTIAEVGQVLVLLMSRVQHVVLTQHKQSSRIDQHHPGLRMWWLLSLS